MGGINTTHRRPRQKRTSRTSGPIVCRRKFLRFFPKGFQDHKYIAWERGYKWKAHVAWEESLNRRAWRQMLRQGRFQEIAAQAVRIESRTNLLFSFEKMALRDAVRQKAGAKILAEGLYNFLYASRSVERGFEAWCDAVGALPRRKTRVLTWPLLTVFPFIAQPNVHMFLKPLVTKHAAFSYGFDFNYRSKPAWDTYKSLLMFAKTVRRDQRELHPRDMVDIQSFIWVQGSDEYE